MGSSIPKSQGIAKKIEIYGTNTCPYCLRAKKMFSDMGASYEFINTRDHPEKRTEIGQKYNWNTIPMILVDGKFCGGFSDTQKLIEEGKLII